MQAERFRIERELGAGRRARVFEATDLLLGRQVALKRAHQPGPHLAEEAQRLARCPDGAAPHLYDFLPESPATLVLERLEGTTWRSHFETARPPLHETIRLFDGALAAVAALHAVRLVHGDLKPENLWIEPQGRVRLLDLGAEPVAGGDGTALYQAPEIARGGVPDATGDVYALAAIAFESLAGRPPFDATDAAELAVRRAQRAAPRLHAAGATVPAAIEAWVAHGLEGSSAARFVDASTALAAWREATADLVDASASCQPSAPVILHPETAARLRQHVRAARDGSGLVLRGESGIGKSTLLEITTTAVRDCHGLAIVVRPALAGRRAFLDWDLAAGPDNPSFESRLGPEPIVQAHLCAALADSARRRPTWILVDDPEALDGATRRLVVRLARDAGVLGIHVITTLDPTRARRAARWMRDAFEALALPTLEIEAISAPAWSRFLAGALDGGISEALCQHVVQRCGGNPRQAQWIVDDWRQRGVLRREGEAWIFRPEPATEPLPLPLERAFTAWQAALNRFENRVLGAAAVQGCRFDAATVADIESLPVDDVWRCLHDLARDRGIVRRSDSGWEFRTPLLVNYWRARLDPERRANAHRRIAARLLARHEPDALRIGEQLALGGDRHAALPYILQSVRAALAARDATAAVRGLEFARDDEPASEIDAEAAVELLRLRAEAFQLLAGWDAAVAALEQARVLARAWGLGAAEIAILRGLGSIDYERSCFDEAVGRYHEARTCAEALADESELHEIDLKIGNIHFERGRLEDAATLYDGVLAYATAAGNADLEARAACNVALVESIRGRKQQAIALFDRSLVRFRALGRHDAVARLHQNIGMIYFELGNWAEARNFFAACMQQCESSGQDALYAVAAVDYAEATIRLGAAAAAREPLERALAICRERGDELGVANAYRLQGQLAALDGDRAAAEERLATSLNLLDQLGQPMHQGLAWRDLGSLRLQAGDVAGARDALSRARRTFAALAAAEHSAEVETLWSQCAEVASCPP